MEFEPRSGMEANAAEPSAQDLQAPPPESAEATSASAETRVRRQHPSALIFDLVQTLRSLFVPGLAVIFVSRGDEFGWEFYAMVAVVPVAVIQVTRYLTLRYELRSTELVLRQGLFNRNERHIPFDRIQDIDTRQSPIHRLLGVAGVRLRTATDGAPEAELTALTSQAIAELRRAIQGARGNAATERAPSESDAHAESGDLEAPDSPRRAPRLGLSARDLLTLSLVRNRGLLALAATLGIAGQYGILDRVTDLPFLDALKNIPGIGELAGFGFVGFGFVFLVLLSPLISIPWTFLRYGNFKLELDGEHLRIEKGLWTRTSLALPRRRIQRLSIVEGPLHRLFGVVSVYAINAGRSGADPGATGGSELVPILERHLVDAFLRTFTPEFQVQGEWRPPHPRARQRLRRGALIAPVVLGLLLAKPLGLWALAVTALLLAYSLPSAKREADWLAWQVTEDKVASRVGAYVRRTIIAPVSKLQTATERESVLDRRWGMRHLLLDTAGGLGVRPLELRLMEAKETQRLREALSVRVDDSDFRW